MTEVGRKVFYLQHPMVQEKSVFYTNCAEGEASIVLGCYKPGRGIFLLQVTDQRLAGVEQTTAAHETLHAIYNRLNPLERKKVDTLVTEAYKAVTDTGIRDKMKTYETSGADLPNELHSVLGTEVADLPPDLEAYYAKYFSNRRTIVNYSAAYKSEFSTRKAKVLALDAQLKQISDQIAANNTQLDAQQATINAESNRLSTLLQQGNVAAYNSGVSAYNKSLIPFRSLASKTQQLIAEYKSLLDQRNLVASEAQALEKELDTRLKPSVVNEEIESLKTAQ